MNNLNEIFGVAGSIAGIIAAIITVITFFETRRNINESKEKKKDNIELSSRKIVANEICKRDIIIYDNLLQKALIISILITISISGISYFALRNTSDSLLIFLGTIAFLNLFIILPFRLYWLHRLKKIILKTDIDSIWKFVEKHDWKSSVLNEDIEKIIRKIQKKNI